MTCYYLSCRFPLYILMKGFRVSNSKEFIYYDLNIISFRSTSNLNRNCKIFKKMGNYQTATHFSEIPHFHYIYSATTP